jgi:hypothetical protein
MENVNPHEELRKLDDQIRSATSLAALEPVYFRLKEIIEAFPDDFDIEITGSEIKRRLIARGTVLKHQAPPPPLSPAPPPAMPEAQSYPPPPFMDAPGPSLPPLPPPPFEDAAMGEAQSYPPPPFMDTPTGEAQSYPPPPFRDAPTGEAQSYPPPPFRDTPTGEAQSYPPPPFRDAPTGEAPLFPPPAPFPGSAQPEPPPPAPPRPKRKRSPALAIGIALCLLAALAAAYFVAKRLRKPNPAGEAAVQVDITTTPPGAAVTVSGGASQTCTSNCQLPLMPGAYQISASLDGYESAVGAVTVTPRQPVSVNLTLQPQALSLRLLTDLDQGKVTVDDRPAADLQEGQLVLDKVAPGTHTVKVAGQKGDASFSFEAADARLPAVAGAVTAHNVVALLVASFGHQARVVTNAGPWKLAVNGQPQGDAGPAGTDLTGFRPGVNEIVLGTGADARNMSESFGAAPMLTAFLKTDANSGTLIVSTGQDDVRVFLNDKEYRRRTLRGELRVPALGKVAVRVAKSGFQDEPAQTVELKKGAEVRVQFNLKPQPQFASLEIRGAAAGTQVLVDQRDAGAVGPDGSFRLGSIQPGDHTVELRREQYVPKRLQRSFVAGQSVALAGADVMLAAAGGAVRIARNPASAAVTYRRNDEAEPHEARGDQIELAAGAYTFSASAPGFAESTKPVQVAAGETRTLDFTLVRQQAAAPPPPAAPANPMADFEDAVGWKKTGDTWVHKGGGFVAFNLPPKGVITFTVAPLKTGGRAGQVRWFVQFLDGKNYLLYEIDKKNFWAGVIEKGKRFERLKTAHNLATQQPFTIQVEVAADHLSQKVRVGGDWKLFDNFVEAGRDFTKGKFGFLIQGSDEIGISDFKFAPK